MTITSPLRSIAVFCGSNYGFNPDYIEGARALGREIARRGLRLVYGGTDKGLMGVMADTVLAEGGEVVDPLALKPWGDHDGQVRDRFGVTWLIGYQG